MGRNSLLSIPSSKGPSARGSDRALESVTPVKTFLAFAVGEKSSFKPYDFSLIGLAFLWHQMETCQIRKKKNFPFRADKEKPAADSEAPGTEIAGFDVGSSEGDNLSRLIARRRHSQREKSISPATICHADSCIEHAAMQNSYRMFSLSVTPSWEKGTIRLWQVSFQIFRGSSRVFVDFWIPCHSSLAWRHFLDGVAAEADRVVLSEAAKTVSRRRLEFGKYKDTYGPLSRRRSELLARCWWGERPQGLREGFCGRVAPRRGQT